MTSKVMKTLDHAFKHTWFERGNSPGQINDRRILMTEEFDKAQFSSLQVEMSQNQSTDIKKRHFKTLNIAKFYEETL